MAPPVVYDGVRNDAPNTEGLFAGQKFWFSSTVPQKSRFIDDVKANGGQVVLLEKQADICLYDHARKNPPPGMYSYRYVEYSVRKGQHEDLEAHRIGSLDSRAARPVGSVTLASKGSRTAFTEADDQMLWEWVKPHEGMRGSAGNVIYQQLEAANPRHTFQSWRDRWLKYVQFQKRHRTPTDEQRQHEAAPEVAQPTVTRTNTREPRTGAGAASESPRVVVEVPVKESPRRKRGRPPKIQQDQPNEGTIDVVSSPVAKQRQTPSRSMRKENVDRPQVEKTSISKGKSNAGSWEFSNTERDLLLSAVEVILQVPEDDAGPAWERMAESHQSHTAEQWRNFFHEVVLPFHHTQQKKSPKRKKKTENIDAEARDPRYHANTEARRSKEEQEEGHMEISPGKTRQNGIEINEPTAAKARRRLRSPSFQPQSPVDWKSENDVHRPAPNQSRKRSPAKSNSQESAAPHNLGSRADSTQTLSQNSEIVQHSNENIQDGNLRPTKRRKLSLTHNTVLEIPSTPEHTQESETLEDLPASPTPRPRKRSSHKLERSFSPLFVLSDGADEGDNLPTTPKRAAENSDSETGTSPISVHLVSDQDPDIISSPSVATNRNAETGSTGSPTPEFETAPDFSRIHRDVSESGDDQEEFETAAEEQQVVAQKASLPDTQALFAAPTQANGEGSLDLGLPDPEGGWDGIEIDADPAQQEDEGEAIASPASSSTASTLNLDLDAWVNLRVAEGRDIALLLTAAEATNMHKKTADMVYESLESGNGVPGNVRGVWTREDDELLMGTDARGVMRVQEKHGRRSVDDRFECLGVWNA